MGLSPHVVEVHIATPRGPVHVPPHLDVTHARVPVSVGQR